MSSLSASRSASPSSPRALLIHMMWSKRQEGSKLFAPCSPIVFQAILTAPQSAWDQRLVEKAIIEGVRQGANAFNSAMTHPSFSLQNPEPPSSIALGARRLEPAGLFFFEARSYRGGPRADEPLSNIELLRAAAYTLSTLEAELSPLGEVSRLGWHPKSSGYNGFSRLSEDEKSFALDLALIRQFMDNPPRMGAQFPAELLPELSRDLESALLDIVSALGSTKPAPFRI